MRLILWRSLREGEEVLFFLAESRHTLISATSLGIEGDSMTESMARMEKLAD